MTSPEHDQAAQVARTQLGLPTPDLEAALKVETTVEIVDYEGLGIVVSELTDHQQAEFLTGLVEGFSRFGTPTARDHQLAYIARTFKDSPDVARGVIALLRDLAEFMVMAVNE